MFLYRWESSLTVLLTDFSEFKFNIWFVGLIGLPIVDGNIQMVHTIGK